MIVIASPGGIRERGGMGRVVDTIASELAVRHPHLAVRVVDTYGPGPFVQMPFRFALALARLAGLFAFRRVQLLHIHMAERGSVLRKGLAMALARLFGVPVVLHLHAGQLHDQFDAAGPVERGLLRGAVGLADEVVVLGGFYRDFVQRAFAPRRVTILPNAVPGPDTVPERTHGGPVRLLFLGRLVPIKGLAVLFEALASPALAGRAWTLTVGGDGDRAFYEVLAARHGLTARVRFTGWLDRDGCRRELSAADALVQPSFAEGLPMAVLEAMAHGLPVIATPVGAVLDALADGGNGLVVPPGSAEELAAALVRLIDEPAFRHRLGAQARADYERRYTLAIYTERLIDIYRRNACYWPDRPAAALRQGTLPS
jgi:glycosyltransferase involved in cell wall biosynthesis